MRPGSGSVKQGRCPPQPTRNPDRRKPSDALGCADWNRAIAIAHPHLRAHHRFAPNAQELSSMHDIVIRGGTIIDGTGAPSHTGDVAVAGERIAAVGGKRAEHRAALMDLMEGVEEIPGVV